MCGIAGIVGRIGDANRIALRRMTDAMSHRGPDGEGMWIGPADERGLGVMLGHRRLSILDLSDAASQPMVDPERGDVAVLNGEIYNYLSLRGALESAGHRLHSTGDTAAMLRHLSVHGFDAVRDLRGMFAIAVWDPRRRELLLARDALGIKPLYVTRNPDPKGDWILAFASEVRALLRCGLLPRPALSAPAVNAVVWQGFTTAPLTAVEGVESLWPGEMRILGQDGVERGRSRFWTMSSVPSGPSASERDVSLALEDSVRRHLASDVPLGVFLSGGVDSSAVANVARRVAAGPVHSFTLAFEEAARNEGGYARAVARAIGTEHHEVLLSQRDFLDGLDAALATLDQPSFDALNSFFMSRAVARVGFKVALVGSGGDELFGGYKSFRDLPTLAAWARRFRVLPTWLLDGVARSVLAVRSRRGGTLPSQTRWAKLPAMLRVRADLLALYQLAYALFLPDTYDSLLGPRLLRSRAGAGLPSVLEEALRAETAGRSDLQAISIYEQRMFLGERLLRDSDATSMAVSIEIRLPLVDQDLLETVARVPDRVRFQPICTKALLRRVGLAGLDQKLFDRPKSGFELPFDSWLRSALGQHVDAVLSDNEAVAATGLNPAAVLTLWNAFRDGAPGLYWTRIWCLYALIHWARQNGLSIRSAA